MTEQTKFSESIETPFSVGTFSRFVGIDEVQFSEFKSRLMTVGGHCRMVVHPLYTEQHPSTASYFLETEEQSLPSVQNELRDSLQRLVVSVSGNLSSSPLLVYESVSHSADTKQQIQDWIGNDNLAERGIVMIPTAEHTSVLQYEHIHKILMLGSLEEQRIAEKIGNLFTAKRQYLELRAQQVTERLTLYPESIDFEWRVPDDIYNEYFEYLLAQHDAGDFYFNLSREVTQIVESFQLAFFKQIGMRSAIVSGAYVTSSYSSQEKKHDLGACAGGLIQFLRDNHIQTDISRNIFPSKQKLRDDGVELKQTNKVS